METALLWIVLILLVLLLAVVFILIIIFIKGGYKTTEQPARSSGPPVTYSSPTAYGRCWHLEIWNLTTNEIFAKDFYGQVMLGRSTSAEELFWQMRVGNDPSISREQCVVYDRGGFLVVENVSQVNMTLLNGYQITQPMMLSQGCQLTAGRSVLYISVAQRIS